MLYQCKRRHRSSSNTEPGKKVDLQRQRNLRMRKSERSKDTKTQHETLLWDGEQMDQTFVCENLSGKRIWKLHRNASLFTKDGSQTEQSWG
jgi:hypothetical protein